ncbi:MAG: hypothetical protein JO163_12000, partial [Methylobacteriaceae bacterium]|nr:hypothetical protein [Methylobacteriaceae bacterium]
RDLKASGRIGVLQCDLTQGAAARLPGAFDAGIERLADGWYRCWVSVQLCDRGAAIGIDLPDGSAVLPTSNSRPHLLLRDARLQPGWRLVGDGTRLLPITPIARQCDGR